MLVAENIIFKERSSVWLAKNFLTVVLDIDFSPVMNECDDVKTHLETLAGVYNYTHTIRNYTDQVCRITDNWRSAHSVEKRQAVAAAIGFTFGSVFGLINRLDIKKLEHRVTNFDARLTRGFVILRKHETRMGRIEDDLQRANANSLWKMAAIQFKFGQLEAVIDFGFHVSMLHVHTEAIARSWTALLAGHLSEELLEPQQWASVMNRIKAEAIAMGGHLPHLTQQEFLQLPTSFLAKGPRWKCYMHVPFLSERYRMYEYVPTPLFLDEQANTSARIVTLEAEANLLLIAPDDALHREVSHRALQDHCQNWGHQMVCENLGAFTRRTTDSCLGALFKRNTTRALTLCKVQPVLEEWKVIPLTHSDFLTFSKKGRVADTICQNGTRRNALIQGLTTIRLEEGCALTSEAFYLERGSPKTLELHLTTSATWNQGDLEIAWTRAQAEARATVGQVRRLVEEARDRAKERPDRIPDGEWLPDPLTTDGRDLLLALVACSLALGVLHAGALGYLAWRYWKAPAPVTGGNPGPPL
jgi:hypothetical protein